MKKVAFVISTLNIGGAERTVSNLSLNLPDNEWNIEIIINNDDELQLPYKGKIVSLGLKRNGAVTDYVYQIRLMLRRIHILKRLKKNEKYDVCISFMDSANIANLLTVEKGVTTIVSIRNSLIEHQNLLIYRKLVIPFSKMLYKKADKIVAVTNRNAEEVQQLFQISPEKIAVINNGYNVKEIGRLGEELLDEQQQGWLDNSDFVVVTCGRLVEQKAQWHLIRAFHYLRDSMPKAKLLILGDGKLKAYLSGLIEELNEKDRIILCGNLNNPFKIIKRSQLFVLTSMYEGYPNALAESICCNIPNVVTDFESGAREILQYNSTDDNPLFRTDYGYVVPLCDGVKYDAQDSLTVGEKTIAQAITIMKEDTVFYNNCVHSSIQRAKELEISNIIKQWISIMN